MKPARHDAVAEQEQCPACLQLYSYHLEYRCVMCDDAVCPLCVVRLQVAWVCPDCAEEA